MGIASRSIEVFEIKLSKAPRPSRGFHGLVNDLNPQRAWIVAPVDEPYELSKIMTVTNPENCFGV